MNRLTVAVAQSLVVAALFAVPSFADDEALKKDLTAVIALHGLPCGQVVAVKGVNEMNAVKMAAVVLIAAGVLGLVYGSFSYTKDTHEAKLGPLELSVKDKETVNVPVWAGVGAIVIGGALLLIDGKKG